MTVATACAPAAPVVAVEGGRLTARTWDGSLLPDAELVGLELTLPGAHARELHVRIDAQWPSLGPLGAYAVSRLDEATGRWVPYCEPGRDGRRIAVALAGHWEDDGAGPFVEDPHDFTLTCTAGSNGKCARLGYVPGLRTAHGESLTPYFEACVRMMRADYCGDGRSFTEPGVAVELQDRAGRSTRAHGDEPLAFEAVWGPRGAICVHHPRHAERLSLRGIGERCPRLAAALGERCQQDVLQRDPDARFVSRSRGP